MKTWLAALEGTPELSYIYAKDLIVAKDRYRVTSFDDTSL